MLLVLSAWRGGLNTIAGWLGVAATRRRCSSRSATLFILAVLLHYSTVISKLSDQNVVLAQRLALLEQRIRPDREWGLAVALDGLADHHHVAPFRVVPALAATPIRSRARWR